MLLYRLVQISTILFVGMLILLCLLFLEGCGSWHLDGVPKSEVPEYLFDEAEHVCKRYASRECATVGGDDSYYGALYSDARNSRRGYQGRHQGPRGPAMGWRPTPFQRCTHIHYRDCMEYNGWEKY